LRIKVDYSDLEKFHQVVEKLKDDMPELMNRYAVAEGDVYTTKAKKLTKEKGKVLTGNFKRSWHSDERATVIGNTYKVGVGNTAKYSLFIERGFRSHFVPGRWKNKRFVYDPNEKGGMIVGKFRVIKNRAVPYGTVDGMWISKEASKYVEDTQSSRVERKILKELRSRFND
jgi:hypothetical protein